MTIKWSILYDFAYKSTCKQTIMFFQTKYHCTNNKHISITPNTFSITRKTFLFQQNETKYIYNHQNSIITTTDTIFTTSSK